MYASFIVGGVTTSVVELSTGFCRVPVTKSSIFHTHMEVVVVGHRRMVVVVVVEEVVGVVHTLVVVVVHMLVVVVVVVGQVGDKLGRWLGRSSCSDEDRLVVVVLVVELAFLVALVVLVVLVVLGDQLVR
jgi:hypothetical protein